MKKHNILKVLTIGILVSIVLSYFIPGTSISYGTIDKGPIHPITFADTFTNGITAFSAFLPSFLYVLVIGLFYAVLHKTNKYDTLVNNVAVIFNKNKGLFIVLTIFVIGLFTMFTGDIFAILLFVPFLISVIEKLGYNKKVSVISTLGAILLGNAGSLYTYYANQMLSLTVNDNVLVKVLIALIGLVSLVAFILIFNEAPTQTRDLKKQEKAKVLPLHIIMWSLLVLFVLGFVNWNAYTKYTGFETFLETLRKGTIAKVSVFDAIVGSNSIASFGTWQIYNAATLLVFVSVLVALIYRVKINDFFDAVAEGIKKAFPYALIVVLLNIILVNVFTSGFFYTIVIGLTKKTVSMFTSVLTSVISVLCFPDYGYATQFTLTAVTNTKATGYESIFAIVFQSVYNILLLVSPTSVLLLILLKYKNIRYGEWVKYIYKYIIVLLFMTLVAISVIVIGFTVVGIIALILLLTALILIFYNRIKNTLSVKTAKVVEVKEEKKEEVKKETVKKTAPKKQTNKPAKKNGTKKTNKK